jgi:hypothetical protein
MKTLADLRQASTNARQAFLDAARIAGPLFGTPAYELAQRRVSEARKALSRAEDALNVALAAHGVL